MAQNKVGEVYKELADRGIDSKKNLSFSIEAFKEAASLWKNQKDGASGYAMSQNSLGLSYQALADMGIEHEENKKRADEAFQEFRNPHAKRKE